MTQPIVRIQNLEKIFGDNVVLRDFDLEVQKGECVRRPGPCAPGRCTTR